MIKFILVFFASAMADWVWAAYIMYTAEKNAVRSSLLSGVIIVMGAFVTLSYLDDKRMLVAAVAGGILGTYVSVKFKKEDAHESQDRTDPV